MVKHIKACIRANQNTMFSWERGDLSYGKMANVIAESILTHIESKGMLPPSKYNISHHDSLYTWEEETKKRGKND